MFSFVHCPNEGGVPGTIDMRGDVPDGGERRLGWSERGMARVRVHRREKPPGNCKKTDMIIIESPGLEEEVIR